MKKRKITAIILALLLLLCSNTGTAFATEIIFPYWYSDSQYIAYWPISNIPTYVASSSATPALSVANVTLELLMDLIIGTAELIFLELQHLANLAPA